MKFEISGGEVLVRAEDDVSLFEGLESLVLDFQRKWLGCQRGKIKAAFSVGGRRAARLTCFFTGDVTVADGIMPPVESVTAPEIDPVMVWAVAVTAKAIIAMAARKVELRSGLNMWDTSFE